MSFTQDQTDSINAFQACGYWHPFTCGDHCGATLIATVDGFICPTENCGYTQDWAHVFMCDWSWKRSDAMIAYFERKRPAPENGAASHAAQLAGSNAAAEKEG